MRRSARERRLALDRWRRGRGTGGGEGARGGWVLDQERLRLDLAAFDGRKDGDLTACGTEVGDRRARSSNGVHRPVSACDPRIGRGRGLVELLHDGWPSIGAVDQEDQLGATVDPRADDRLDVAWFRLQDVLDAVAGQVERQVPSSALGDDVAGAIAEVRSNE